jgi:hypothetical protein
MDNNVLKDLMRGVKPDEQLIRDTKRRMSASLGKKYKPRWQYRLAAAAYTVTAAFVVTGAITLIGLLNKGNLSAVDPLAQDEGTVSDHGDVAEPDFETVERYVYITPDGEIEYHPDDSRLWNDLSVLPYNVPEPFPQPVPSGIGGTPAIPANIHPLYMTQTKQGITVELRYYGVTEDTLAFAFRVGEMPESEYFWRSFIKFSHSNGEIIEGTYSSIENVGDLVWIIVVLDEDNTDGMFKHGSLVYFDINVKEFYDAGDIYGEAVSSTLFRFEVELSLPDDNLPDDTEFHVHIIHEDEKPRYDGVINQFTSGRFTAVQVECLGYHEDTDLPPENLRIAISTYIDGPTAFSRAIREHLEICGGGGDSFDYYYYNFYQTMDELQDAQKAVPGGLLTPKYLPQGIEFNSSNIMKWVCNNCGFEIHENVSFSFLNNSIPFGTEPRNMPSPSIHFGQIYYGTDADVEFVTAYPLERVMVGEIEAAAVTAEMFRCHAADEHSRTLDEILPLYTLYWMKDGVGFTLASSYYDFETLITVAESMF